MAPQILHRVCYGTTSPTPFQISSLTIHPAILPNYCRHKVIHADYPAITPSSLPSSSVRGTIVSGLTDGDLRRLDIFEGDEYERRKVKVRFLELGVGVSEEEVEVETYVWVAREEGLEEGEWDFEEFTREKMGRWVGNEEYDEVDQAVKAGEVDPTRGRRRGGEILGRLDRDGEKEKEILKGAV
ncbi:hypothetical protein MMC14_006734 [Varicellaria rhodocarpa]|nr:hypothetical protein [Varicellaria rhodocarpa]